MIRTNTQERQEIDIEREREQKLKQQQQQYNSTRPAQTKFNWPEEEFDQPANHTKPNETNSKKIVIEQ